VSTTRTGPAIAACSNRPSAARPAGSVVLVNSSSHWSIGTSSEVWPSSVPSASSSSARSRNPLSCRSFRRTRRSDQDRPARLAVDVTAVARAATGSSPGDHGSRHSQSGSVAMTGVNPARTSEDFPLPDSPVTATTRRPVSARSRAASSLVSCARPKKTLLSAAVNGARPG
jgi:hypothetical protein